MLTTQKKPTQHRLLSQEGYTIRGVQQLLARGGAAEAAAPVPIAAVPANQHSLFPLEDLRALRATLADALAESR